MTETENGRDDRVENPALDERIRRWALRTPRTPSREAARTVVARLRDARVPARRRLTAAAAILALALLAVLIRPDGVVDPPGREPARDAPRLEAPLLDETVALIWLDSETPLYLTLEVPSPKHRKGESP